MGKADAGQQLRNIHPSQDVIERLLLLCANLKSSSAL